MWLSIELVYSELLLLFLRKLYQYITWGSDILPQPYTTSKYFPEVRHVLLFTSLADARSLILQTPHFTSCDAIELAEMGQGRDDRLFLLVRLFNVSHGSRLECVKSIVLTASVPLSCPFSSRRLSSARAALSVASPMGACKKAWCRFSHSASRHGLKLFLWPRGIASLAAVLIATQKRWYASSKLSVFGGRRWSSASSFVVWVYRCQLA